MRRPMFVLAGALMLASAAAAQADDAPQPDLVLMGTVPIYWGEADGLSDMLAGGATAHWARAELEQEYTLVPLDYLSAEALAGERFLLMAQPRALSGEENVALDDWVRGGGRLLLLADPWMTGESRFAIGDRRRPQDVALLSPILARWGMELVFDEDQQAGVQMREIAGTAIPVNLAGQFRLVDPSAQCALESAGLLAKCGVGTGHVTILADAAVLDIEHPGPGASRALSLLVQSAFGETGDRAGNTSPSS